MSLSSSFTSLAPLVVPFPLKTLPLRLRPRWRLLCLGSLTSSLTLDFIPSPPYSSRFVPVLCFLSPFLARPTHVFGIPMVHFTDSRSSGFDVPPFYRGFIYSSVLCRSAPFFCVHLRVEGGDDPKSPRSSLSLTLLNLSLTWLLFLLPFLMAFSEWPLFLGPSWSLFDFWVVANPTLMRIFQHSSCARPSLFLPSFVRRHVQFSSGRS